MRTFIADARENRWGLVGLLLAGAVFGIVASLLLAALLAFPRENGAGVAITYGLLAALLITVVVLRGGLGATVGLETERANVPARMRMPVFLFATVAMSVVTLLMTAPSP